MATSAAAAGAGVFAGVGVADKAEALGIEAPSVSSVTDPMEVELSLPAAPETQPATSLSPPQAGNTSVGSGSGEEGLVGTTAVDDAPATASSSAAAPGNSTAVPPAPGSGPESAADEVGLLEEELSGWGLDGAFVWMKKFQAHLEQLCPAREGATDKGRAAVEIILKLVRNVVENPSEAKYRNFKRSNPVIATKVLSTTEGLEMLKSLGFELESDQERYNLSDRRYDGGKLRMAKELLEQKLQQ